ncbi:hypothetical protein PAXINDRAFT_103433 [Paxillus involutus ATCC 200175]|uniref:DUF6534 domain-containing protein n=1 Tax=Paxillus involutus ATCC 200175 TaxID=664439 RepID=A0A0C9TDJ5_PAXIN|nr:hypothetical protein PAXINDRAFT_103433 [Paxillus involutus ATCC 200175]
MTPTITVSSGPVLMVRSVQSRDPIQWLTANFKKVGYACLGIAAATDVIIATAMFVLLAKGRTQFNNHTDRILFHWTIISIHTVFWTASFAVITVILHALHPSDLLFTATYFPICELYCNTLLANFNARSWVGSNRVSPVSLSNRRRSDKPMAAAVPLPPFDISIETSKRMDSESYENHASFSV